LLDERLRKKEMDFYEEGFSVKDEAVWNLKNAGFN